MASERCRTPGVRPTPHLYAKMQLTTTELIALNGLLHQIPDEAFGASGIEIGLSQDPVLNHITPELIRTLFFDT